MCLWMMSANIQGELLPIDAYKDPLKLAAGVVGELGVNRFATYRPVSGHAIFG